MVEPKMALLPPERSPSVLGQGLVGVELETRLCWKLVMTLETKG